LIELVEEEEVARVVRLVVSCILNIRTTHTRKGERERERERERGVCEPGAQERSILSSVVVVWIARCLLCCEPLRRSTVVVVVVVVVAQSVDGASKL
jgi:hypothetical protein